MFVREIPFSADDVAVYEVGVASVETRETSLGRPCLKPLEFVSEFGSFGVGGVHGVFLVSVTWIVGVWFMFPPVYHRVEINLIEMSESGDESVEVGYAEDSLPSTRGSQFETGSFYTHGTPSGGTNPSTLASSSDYIGALVVSAQSLPSTRALVEEDPAEAEAAQVNPPAKRRCGGSEIDDELRGAVTDLLRPKHLGDKPVRFRANCRGYLLTYPRTIVSVESCMKWFVDKEGEKISYIIVSHEKHMDDSDHLHVVVFYKSRLDVKSCTRFNGACGKQCNIRRIDEKPGSEFRVVRYVTKYGDYCSWPPGFHVESYKKSIEHSKRSGLLAEIASKMRDEGKTVAQLALDDRYAAFVLMHVTNLKRYQALLTIAAAEPTLPYKIESDCGFFMVFAQLLRTLPTGLSPEDAREICSLNFAILRWLRSNIRKEVDRRQQRNLWIAAPPHRGKTHFTAWLGRMIRIVVWSAAEGRFCDAWSDAQPEVAVWDEFHSHVSVYLMNQLLDGSPFCTVPGKGFQAVKMKDVPGIVLSNSRLRDAYMLNKEDAVIPTAVKQAFRDRFIEIDFTSFSEDCRFAGVQHQWFDGRPRWHQFPLLEQDHLVQECRLLLDGVC